jgi:diguanylate cyclase (GGDEF)-like protein/PAS domain S-box-containing protein
MSVNRTSSPVTRQRRLAPLDSAPAGWQVVDSLAVPFFAVDADNRIFYLNAAATRLLGVSARRAVGRPFSDVVRICDGSNHDLNVAPSQLLGTKPDNETWRLVRRTDGSTVPVQLLVAPLGATAGEAPPGIGVVLQDQSGVQQLVERLTHRCAHDDLTGLVNRAEFEKRLAGAISGARAGGHAHALCFMDLNEFKAVNDRHGHLAGDKVLQYVASRFLSLIRDRDTLARLGGDEFALLLEHCSVERAVHTARLMRFTLKQSPPIWQEMRVNVGISIGITPINQQNVDCQTVLAAADAACYTAKREGHDSICVLSGRDLAGKKIGRVRGVPNQRH